MYGETWQVVVLTTAFIVPNMKEVFVNSSAVVTALALIILTGCAMFPGNVIPKVSSFPVASEKPSVSVDLSFRQYMNGRPANLAVKSVEAAMQKKIIERFQMSGLYSSVAKVNPNSDVSVVVEMKDEGSGSFGMAFLTGLTLYIIPSSATDLFKVKAIVKNKRTGIEKTVECEDFVTQWQEILLLPFLPFNFPPSVADGVVNNIMDTIALKVHTAATGTGVTKTVFNLPVPAAENRVVESANSADVSMRLKILKEALDAGLITRAEYDYKKAQLEPVKTSEADVLKKLKILKEACETGLITQSEYEQKKAELVKGI